MILKLIFIGICLICGGLFKGLSDLLIHHYDRSIFPKIGEKAWFWNPRLSWRNKWKDGKKENGEKFPGSSTIFVALTDAWHLSEFFRFAFLRLAMILVASFHFDFALWIWICLWVIIMVPRGFGFWLGWRIIFRRA